MKRGENLRSPAWLLLGLVKSVPGTLECVGERLSFTSASESFTTPLDAIETVTFPWYYFGAGLVLVIEGKRYRLSLVEPGDTGDIVTGRALGQRWKARLAQAGAPAES